MYGAAGKAGQAKCKAILNEFDMEYLTRTDMDWSMHSWSALDSVMVWR